MEHDVIPSSETLPQEIIDLMRLVFRAKCEDRTTASELLSHPLIINGTLANYNQCCMVAISFPPAAYQYELCFDEVLEERDKGDKEENSKEFASQQVSSPSLSSRISDPRMNSDDGMVAIQF